MRGIRILGVRMDERVDPEETRTEPVTLLGGVGGGTLAPVFVTRAGRTVPVLVELVNTSAPVKVDPVLTDESVTPVELKTPVEKRIVPLLD